MSAVENIERLVKKFYTAKKSSIATSAEMDKKILDDALQAIEKSKKAQSAATHPNIWRIIMKTKIAKFAAAAAIIFITGLGIAILDKSTTPAWAIEQTIEALERFSAVHISGVVVPPEDSLQHSFDLWARANEDHSQSGDFRIEIDTGQINWVQGNDTYHYDPNQNTVRILRGQKATINPWIGRDLLQDLEQKTDDWQVSYGNDPATGRDRVFVTCSHLHAPVPKSWWFEFDLETKLPVRFKQWHNLQRKGKPAFDAQRIVYYEELPDETFQFEIPQDAVVIDNWPDILDKLNDPNCGMLAEGITEDEASVEIVRRYWQAAIDGNWEMVARLRPIASPETWQAKYSSNPPGEIIEIGEPYQQKGCSIGPVTPVTIKFQDEDIRGIRMITKFRDINGKSSCVIAGTWGSE